MPCHMCSSLPLRFRFHSSPEEENEQMTSERASDFNNFYVISTNKNDIVSLSCSVYGHNVYNVALRERIFF